MTTLQNKLVKALETIASQSKADKPRLDACIVKIKSLNIHDNDYIKTLAFIKLLLDEVPAASIHNKPLVAIFKHSQKILAAAEEKVTARNRPSKR
jgi:hypothetical protein